MKRQPIPLTWPYPLLQAALLSPFFAIAFKNGWAQLTVVLPDTLAKLVSICMMVGLMVFLSYCWGMVRNQQSKMRNSHNNNCDNNKRSNPKTQVHNKNVTDYHTFFKRCLQHQTRYYLLVGWALFMVPLLIPAIQPGWHHLLSAVGLVLGCWAWLLPHTRWFVAGRLWQVGCVFLVSLAIGLFGLTALPVTHAFDGGLLMTQTVCYGIACLALGLMMPLPAQLSSANLAHQPVHHKEGTNQ